MKLPQLGATLAQAHRGLAQLYHALTTHPSAHPYAHPLVPEDSEQHSGQHSGQHGDNCDCDCACGAATLADMPWLKPVVIMGAPITPEMQLLFGYWGTLLGLHPTEDGVIVAHYEGYTVTFVPTSIQP